MHVLKENVSNFLNKYIISVNWKKVANKIYIFEKNCIATEGSLKLNVNSTYEQPKVHQHI